jgi:hypothetical protein
MLFLSMALLLGFQNCSSGLSVGSKGADNKVSASGGNGGAYDGKLFAEISVGGRCADGSANKTEVMVRPQTRSATLLRENCRDVSPTVVDYAGLGLMPHNEMNVVFENRPLDFIPAAGAPLDTQVFCRTTGVAYSMDSSVATADVVLQDSTKHMGMENFAVKLIVGIYGDKQDLEEVLTKTVTTGGTSYSYSPGSSDYIDITGPTLTLTATLTPQGYYDGSMTYFNLGGNDNTDIPAFVSAIRCYRKTSP